MKQTLPDGRSRRSRDNPKRCADVLLDVLVEAGVEIIWGLPGGAIAPINDALIDKPQIRSITSRHESSAVFSAAGYALSSGKFGVVTVTSGPGLTNALTGLASAYCDGIPVLLLVGEVPRHMQGKGALQDGSAHNLNILSLVRGISKWAFELPDANAAPSMLRRAIATAMSGRKGPVVVTLPLDVTSAPICVPEVSLEISTSFTIAESAANRAAISFRKAKRKVIFAGSGCRHGKGPEMLRRLAEHLQCPVMTTPKGKGVFPESHPLSLGVFGMGGHLSANDYLEKGVETVVAVGTSMGDVATNGFSELLYPSRTLIHVDVDIVAVSRKYAVDLSIAATAEVFFAEMLKRLSKADKKEKFGLRYFNDAQNPKAGSPGRIAPQRALWELQQLLPADTIYAIDSGEHFVFAVHYLKIDHPDSFIAMSGFGSMGSSIPAAIGAKLAQPRRTVAVIIGDGGFAMVGNELAAAHDLNTPIIVSVFNDGRMAMVEIGHKNVFGRVPTFAQAESERKPLFNPSSEITVVDGQDQLLAFDLKNKADRSPVFDVQIDPNVLLPKKDRIKGLV